MKHSLLSSKFAGFLLCVVGLLTAAFVGKFTGELGLYVSGIYGAYVTGNTMITRSAIAKGTEPPAP